MHVLQGLKDFSHNLLGVTLTEAAHALDALEQLPPSAQIHDHGVSTGLVLVDLMQANHVGMINVLHNGDLVDKLEVFLLAPTGSVDHFDRDHFAGPLLGGFVHNPKSEAARNAPARGGPSATTPTPGTQPPSPYIPALAKFPALDVVVGVIFVDD
eukprot:scaffold184_cov379-Prasinococcus_capsulatus_cf.AAC.11